MPSPALWWQLHSLSGGLAVDEVARDAQQLVEAVEVGEHVLNLQPGDYIDKSSDGCEVFNAIFMKLIKI